MLVIGISGTRLQPEERNWLIHPGVGGVILFTRNFASREQVTDLCAELREAAPREVILCVDQEGGPVQRFREGFSVLPELSRFGALFDTDAAGAMDAARTHAWLMASEMRAIGLDLSFAPVVDLKRGNRAIGERAFHLSPGIVADLGAAYVQGMHAAGMSATLKHFPGHGSVLEDTHFDAAVDPRPLDVLEAEDMLPFRTGFSAGAEAVMMAHVSYPCVDAEPAGYSRFWIDYLRNTLKFSGVVFSDDIGMAAAESVGGVAARLHAHYDAGCDSVLVCAPALVPDALAAMRERDVRPEALSSLAGRPAPDWPTLVSDPRWNDAVAALAALA
ncbi:beta-N-acetylhexosaminidase [Xanthomonadaceae bacterium JHOS43]|nr:beta-N-acetylhexosaminidase [Xanthomonadaceae bacterium JHOS43]